MSVYSCLFNNLNHAKACMKQCFGGLSSNGASTGRQILLESQQRQMQSQTSAIYSYKLGPDWGKDTFVEENQAGESTSLSPQGRLSEPWATILRANTSRDMSVSQHSHLWEDIAKYVQFGDFQYSGDIGQSNFQSLFQPRLHLDSMTPFHLHPTRLYQEIWCRRLPERLKIIAYS